MKNLKTISFLIVSLVLILFSCGKEDEDDMINVLKSEHGSFKFYKGFQYKISDPISTGSTPFRVIFVGEGVNYDKASDAFSGIGSVMCFDMYSGLEVEVKDGLYTIDIFSNDSIGYAGDCDIYFNYDFAQDTGKVFYVNAGTFDVKNLGSIMEYDITVVAESVNYRRFRFVEENFIQTDSIVADNILFRGVFNGAIPNL